ncbi:hypothetical protein L1049_005866 [Liquidambar formosana]|uniref:Late embryogenesis abundant protein LEA-2 subgroup domain-containing protein n=1 Tax=Liquidambar formosana TaxID=63359 RepID=A0AAP0REE4_LIQFO
MAAREQVKPLAPAAYWISSDGGEAMSVQIHKLRQRKYIKCCGCITALLLILVVIVLILMFTVFHIKNPDIKMNAINFQRLGLQTLTSGENVTVVADVSIKNPNVATFRFSNITTTVYYDSVVVGEARLPPGRAKARRTLRMNVTVDIVTAQILAIPSLPSDLRSGALSMRSYTKIGGRVKILNIFKKYVVVELNCTVTVNTTSQAIKDQKCNPRVSL